MSILQDATDTLRAIEADLLAAPQHTQLDATSVAERIHRVIELLADENAGWVGTTEAKRLLGLGSENTVKAWARLGLLRSRTLPNGRVQVLLEDVLARRAQTEDLTAIDGDDLSPEELRILRETRPETNPWERQGTE